MRTHSLLLALTASSLFVAACGGDPPPPPNTPPPTTAAVVAAPPAPAPPEPAKPAAEPVPAAPAAPKGPPPAFQLAGFQTPESVFYDEANDRYLVSNINGKPLDADNNGYISVVSPEGKMVTEKWISGGQNKVTLNAPKGTAIAGGVLYVADIDTVRMFDAKSGAPKGEHKVAGATFLNDVSAGPDGRVYVSDSGLNADFGPTGTDAIYAIDKGKLKTVAKDASLGKPNGLLAAKDSLLLCRSRFLLELLAAPDCFQNPTGEKSTPSNLEVRGITYRQGTEVLDSHFFAALGRWFVAHGVLLDVRFRRTSPFKSARNS